MANYQRHVTKRGHKLIHLKKNGFWEFHDNNLERAMVRKDFCARRRPLTRGDARKSNDYYSKTSRKIVASSTTVYCAFKKLGMRSKPCEWVPPSLTLWPRRKNVVFVTVCVSPWLPDTNHGWHDGWLATPWAPTVLHLPCTFGVPSTQIDDR